MRPINVLQPGLVAYPDCWQAMKNFTDQRNTESMDELWLLQHSPVFTLGQAGKAEHILNAHNIPLVNSDRGGQVTYHGPGQIIVYLLLDIKRLGLGPRALVNVMENSIIKTLADYGIDAYAKKDAPGVYVESENPLINSAKIAALGLRIRKGCSYHGLSLNFNMDLKPFSYINPCGYAGQRVTQINDLIPGINQTKLEASLITHLGQLLQLQPRYIK